MEGEVLPQQSKGHEVRNVNLGEAAGLMAAITWYKDNLYKTEVTYFACKLYLSL